MKTKRLVISVDEKTHAKIKAHCSSIGKNMREVGIRALNDYSQRHEAGFKIGE